MATDSFRDYPSKTVTREQYLAARNGDSNGHGTADRSTPNGSVAEIGNGLADLVVDENPAPVPRICTQCANPARKGRAFSFAPNLAPHRTRGTGCGRRLLW